jgi:hypothetical protein
MRVPFSGAKRTGFVHKYLSKRVNAAFVNTLQTQHWRGFAAYSRAKARADQAAARALRDSP